MTLVQTQDSASLPAHWASKRLFDLCQFIPGKAHEPFIDPLGEYLCVNSKFISTEGQVAKTCNRNITPARKNDILLVMSDLPNGRALGKCFLVDKDNRYAVNQRVCILRPRAGNDPQMLFHLLNRNPYFLSFNDGVNQTHLLNSVFEKCELVVPADPFEQERVGEALSDADALIEGLERLVAKKRLIKQGAMQDLLTAKRRLPGFSGDWAPHKLGERGQFFKGTGVRKDEAKSGFLPCVRYGELYTLHHDVVRHFASFISADVAKTARPIKSGDILFAGSGETKEEIGKCAVVTFEGEMYAGGDIIAFRPSGDDPVFLSYLLNAPAVQKQKARKGQGDAVVHISAKALGDLDLLLPSEEEQSAISAVLEDMDAEIQALDTRLEKARAVKEGMMQNLLTGRVRLV